MPSPEEHESAAAAWLDLPETKREMLVISSRHPDWGTFQVLMFSLQMAILAALEVYGEGTVEIARLEDVKEEEDEDEPWKQKPDADSTGYA